MGQGTLLSENLDRNAHATAPLRRDGRDFKRAVVNISRKSGAAGGVVHARHGVSAGVLQRYCRQPAGVLRQ